MPDVFEFPGFSQEEAPEAGTPVVASPAPRVQIGMDEWVVPYWYLPVDPCAVASVEINAPDSEESPFTFGSDFRANFDHEGLYDGETEPRIVFHRPGPYVLRFTAPSGASWVRLVYVSYRKMVVGELPGNAQTPGGECLEMGARRMEVRIVSDAQVLNQYTDEMHIGPVAKFPTAPKPGTLAEAITALNQLAPTNGAPITVTMLSHGLNSLYSFKPGPFNLDHYTVTEFLRELRTSISRLDFFSCCTGNTVSVGDERRSLLEMLTEAGSPIARACGTTRQAGVTGSVIFNGAGEVIQTLNVKFYIEKDTWVCKDRVRD